MFSSLSVVRNIKGFNNKVRFLIGYLIFLVIKKPDYFPSMLVENNGFYFKTRKGTSDYWHVCREYEPQTKKFLMKHKGRVFLDIGAHIGLYSIILSKNFEKIFSFEPSSLNYRALVRNIKLNLISNIKAQNIALSDKKGVSSFLNNQVNMGQSHLINDKHLPKELPGSYIEKVNIDTVDRFLKKKRIKIEDVDLIKIDVEGCEDKVLSGFKKIKDFSGILILEILDKDSKVKSYLEKNGFETVTTLDGFNYAMKKKNL